MEHMSTCLVSEIQNDKPEGQGKFIDGDFKRQTPC